MTPERRTRITDPGLQSPLPETLETGALEFTSSQMLAQYRVEAKIGEGGMGAVYRGYDTRLQRTVALKVLAPERFTDLERKRRLMREARAASGLNHPNIVTIYEVGSDRDVDFIAMEYVEGKRLDELVAPKGMRASQLLHYAVQIADGLAKAHRAGILHRDLKPSNIMVTPEGRVKLLDFGLAKVMEPVDSSPEAPTITKQALTQEGTVAGTTAYMSPEQALGRKLDARSDVFSFGSILYEMVTGRRPFTADTWLALLTKVVNEDPQPPTQIVPVAQDLEKLILRCLRKDIARRYQTMADLKVALEDLEIETSDRPLLSSTVLASRLNPFRRWMPIRKVALVAAAIPVVVAIAFIGTRVFQRSSEIDSNGTGATALEPIPLTSYEGSERDPSFSPDGSQVAFSWSGLGQDNTDIYVKALGSGPPLRLTTDPARDCVPAWSPDGRYIAFNRGRGGIYLIPPTGGPERKLISRSFFCDAISWTADGKHLAFAQPANGTEPQGIFLVAVEGGSARRLTRAEKLDQHLRPVFSPDGRSLAFVSCVGAASSCDTIMVLPLDAQTNPAGAAQRIDSRHGDVGRIAWTAAGNALVFDMDPGSDDRLWKVSLRKGAEPQSLSFAGIGARTPAIARTVARMAYARVLEDPEIWIVEDAALARSPLSSTFHDGNPQFSPDGRQVVFSSTRSGSSEIWVANVDGSAAVQLTHSKRSGTPRWSPDGRWIVYDTQAADRRYDVNVVDAAGGAPVPVVRHPADDFGPSFSRDGKWVYFGSSRDDRNEIYKAPAAGGEPVRVTDQGGAIGFESVDGKSIYYTKINDGCGVPLFVKSLDGGLERQVLNSVCARAFQVTAGGIYYALISVREGRITIHLLDPASGKSREVRQPKGRLFGNFRMTASPDGNTFLVTGSAQTGSDLYLVENFR